MAAVAGALTIAFSAILVSLAEVEPATAAVFRCAYALPILGLLAWLEDRRYGRRPWRDRRLAIPAGIFFAADLVFWHYAIADVGAGLSTVLGNLQVVVVPFVAWAVLSERPQARLLAALPLVCSGVVLISGVLETGAYGDNPLRGVAFGILTGLTYAGLPARPAAGQLRPPPAGGPAVRHHGRRDDRGAAIAGLAIGEVDLVPAWPSHGWLALLALTSQVLGWLLITVSLPRLPAALTSVTLTIQPVGSVLLGVILLGEDPSSLQLAGVACILAGLVSIALRRDPSRRPVPEPA